MCLLCLQDKLWTLSWLLGYLYLSRGFAAQELVLVRRPAIVNAVSGQKGFHVFYTIPLVLETKAEICQKKSFKFQQAVAHDFHVNAGLTFLT